MMTPREKMKQMPVSAKLRFVREAWEREKQSRIRFLHGNNKRQKVEEAEIALDCLNAIEAALRELV